MKFVLLKALDNASGAGVKRHFALGLAAGVEAAVLVNERVALKRTVRRQAAAASAMMLAMISRSVHVLLERRGIRRELPSTERVPMICLWWISGTQMKDRPRRPSWTSCGSETGGPFARQRRFRPYRSSPQALRRPRRYDDVHGARAFFGIQLTRRRLDPKLIALQKRKTAPRSMPMLRSSIPITSSRSLRTLRSRTTADVISCKTLISEETFTFIGHFTILYPRFRPKAENLLHFANNRNRIFQ